MPNFAQLSPLSLISSSPLIFFPVFSQSLLRRAQPFFFIMPTPVPVYPLLNSYLFNSLPVHADRRHPDNIIITQSHRNYATLGRVRGLIDVRPISPRYYIMLPSLGLTLVFHNAGSVSPNKQNIFFDLPTPRYHPPLLFERQLQ